MKFTEKAARELARSVLRTQSERGLQSPWPLLEKECRARGWPSDRVESVLLEEIRKRNEGEDRTARKNRKPGQYLPGDRVWLRAFEGSPRERCRLVSVPGPGENPGMFVGEVKPHEEGDDGLREFEGDQIEKPPRKFLTNLVTREHKP